MANALQQAGALSEPSNFAPLHTNRIFTGLWTNRSLLRDAATTDYQETNGMGRQDSILGGYNSEISPRLTLIRRAGTKVYNGNAIPPVKRFYSFNTFTLIDEQVRVMADTAATVYDVTAPNVTAIFTKSAAAIGNPTYFLGVGNTLYFTNGIDNKQVVYDPTTGTWGEVVDWGPVAPATAPIVTQAPIVNPYPAWRAGSAFGGFWRGMIVIWDNASNCFFHASTQGVTGATIPAFNPAGGSSTPDGSTAWTNDGFGIWAAGSSYHFQNTMLEPLAGGTGFVYYMFTVQKEGVSGATPPLWTSGLGSLVVDGGCVWKNIGLMKTWDDYGANRPVYPGTSFTGDTYEILDPNGYVQAVQQAGVTSGTTPAFQPSIGALTIDGSLIWINTQAFAPADTAPRQYGYAFKNSQTIDISNMSPASTPMMVIQNSEITVQGSGTGQAGADTVILYRTAEGGSTFLYLDEFPNPGAGNMWTYTDTTPDSGLNPLIQAQVDGEGTPLPAGATALGYHLTRIFAAVGNQIWISSGPDAVVAGSSGNAGFDTVLVAQSKVIRFWACSLGMVVFTVRDAYIILGSATPSDPLYMVVFIEDLPLKSYDCFAINKTTPYLLMGNNQLVALDPSAGIIEAGFPIADRLIDEYDPASSYVTFHSQSTLDTALYVATGAGSWYRMAANNSPEQGSAWSTRAGLANFVMGCVQSVEVTPGSYRLLISGTTAGPILQRDRTVNTDNGVKYPVRTVFGNTVLAQPGQLAALSFITLESIRIGTRAGLALLLGEIYGEFEELKRTRQDPTNLPPSNSLFSDRYHFAQNQQAAWCRHFQMEVTWPAEDAANELLTFTIFGQTWQEMRSQ